MVAILFPPQFLKVWKSKAMPGYFVGVIIIHRPDTISDRIFMPNAQDKYNKFASNWSAGLWWRRGKKWQIVL